ncbi:MAG: glycosyltransferase [Methylobacter sp.]|uniref:Glycosyltransferase n=1 Tax=Candidatus Methylobacter titanis TaxID=3053457 RepID=A0AA43Q5V7_9GAMM|nr:glycosyltransferase [Candidatus Methylobacter titanis]
MKISVVIPTFNSASFIKNTMDSVLAQSYSAYEILVLDDGSTDDTVLILRSYGSLITVATQKNQGVAHARNTLAKLAQGDLVAFLDHDDLWHPSYLAIQAKAFSLHKNAAAVFTKHITFKNDTELANWRESAPSLTIEVIPSDQFIRRYNRSTGTFYSMSFCVVPKMILTSLGEEPFPLTAAGVDDFFLCNQFPLYGPVVLTHGELVAYRLSPNAQSLDQMKNFGLILCHYEHLERVFRAQNRVDLLRLVDCEYASKQRSYGKILFCLSRKTEARKHFLDSLLRSWSPVSMAKSLALLVLSFLPPPFTLRGQPRYRG